MWGLRTRTWSWMSYMEAPKMQMQHRNLCVLKKSNKETLILRNSCKKIFPLPSPPQHTHKRYCRSTIKTHVLRLFAIISRLHPDRDCYCLIFTKGNRAPGTTLLQPSHRDLNFIDTHVTMPLVFVIQHSTNKFWVIKSRKG